MADVVGAMLVRNGEILLGLRAAHKSFAGDWDIIGGHIESGETAWSALRRELIEEIGVECVAGDHLGTLNIGSDPSVLHVYSVSSWEGEASLRNDEHTEIRWFRLDDAERLPNLATPLYRAMFASLCCRS
ncbi:NUDIX domain-containing protein [Sphingomonas sp. KR1UV-12]|uniref:NUDIX domain-containing protein n=1 Tax=Sphingomonas aurea TaxID=3063994 RepID=A0ABT9ELK0_9SPHN|nr:NUDIX domain-containing protein [Sphingomonas sp. KR1UV-12]MDP1027697.1 NUDIX domain-containing protein [Sphingomonas sp. KR1UV-12]